MEEMEEGEEEDKKMDFLYQLREWMEQLKERG